MEKWIKAIRLDYSKVPFKRHMIKIDQFLEELGVRTNVLNKNSGSNTLRN